MSTTLGVELSLETVRAVARDGWRAAVRTVECSWDPKQPDATVTHLRAHFGNVQRIALSVGLAFLHVKQVRLPPTAPRERKRMLALEPDRFFPLQEQSVVVGLSSAQNIAFALDAALLDSWVAAFSCWAPVELVEPVPCSLARALGSANSGTFAIDAGSGEYGAVELQEGQLRAVRRVPDAAEPVAAAPVPNTAAVAGEFVIPLGAARGFDAALDDMLLPAPLETHIRQTRVRRVVLATLVCSIALAAAFWSVDGARERKLAAIRAELAVLQPRARTAMQLQEQLGALSREAAALVTTGQQIDPLEVLSSLSKQLPKGATVLNLKVNGAEWQIDGTANDAAALVPLLDRDDRLENVRFLNASTRFRDGNRTVETFSIAFRVNPGD